MANNEQSKSSSKMSFILGIVSAIAVFSLAGFIIMLVKSGKGGETTKVRNQVEGERQVADQREAGSQEIKMKEVEADEHIRGDKNALITIVEYSDLECPFCKRHHTTMQQIIDEYAGQVKWVYRHFPLDSLHPKARKEAEATECAEELGGNDGFWALTDKIFEVTPGNNRLDLETLPDLAAEVGLDKNKFEECLDSGKYASKVQAQYQDAVTAGGTGTPYNVIIDAEGNKTPASGALPYAQLKQIIDSML